MTLENMPAMIAEIADFFEVVITYIQDLLAKFEEMFQFEDKDYLDEGKAE